MQVTCESVIRNSRHGGVLDQSSTTLINASVTDRDSGGIHACLSLTVVQLVSVVSIMGHHLQSSARRSVKRSPGRSPLCICPDRSMPVTAECLSIAPCSDCKTCGKRTMYDWITSLIVYILTL